MTEYKIISIKNLAMVIELDSLIKRTLMFWNKKKYANGYSTVSINGKTVRVKGNVTGIM